MATVPIRFMRGRDDVYDIPPGRPVIRIMMYKTKTLHGERIKFEIGGETWRKSWALVDTGADQSIIDHAYAQKLGLSPVPGRTVRTQGVNGARIEPIYDLKILMPDGLVDFTVEAISSPLSDHGIDTPIIFGMSLFDQGALRLDFINGIFQLEITPKPIKSAAPG